MAAPPWQAGTVPTRARWSLALALAAGLLTACGGPARHRPSATTTTSAPSTSTTRAAAVSGSWPGGWTTYHGDLTRSGVDRSGERFTPIRVAWSSPRLDGQIYAQPLVWKGLVVVATENDTLYGLDAATGRVVWRTHVGTPAPLSSLPCGNVDPLGILSTPVIDPRSGHLFAVAEEGSGGAVTHELVAVDAQTGRLLFRESADPAVMTDPRAQQQRGALTLSHGRVYIVYGGLDGDCSRYDGLVVAASERGPGPLLSYRVSTPNRGAIWAPPGPSVSAAGDLYVATGNGISTTTYDQGDSVLELSPDLHLLDFFAPSAWARDNADDLDLGSTSPVLLPHGLLFQVGKEGTGYVIRRSDLGHIGGQTAATPVCFTIGGTAYQGSTVYVSCGSGVAAVHVASARSLSVVWRGPAGAQGPPVLAGGMVWSVGWSTGTLYGLDPATGRALASHRLAGTPDQFSTPAFGDRLMLVPAGRRVEAFSGRS